MVAAAIMAATTPVSFFGSSSHTAMRLSGSCCSCSCSYSLASSRSQLGSGAFLAQTFHSLGFSSNVEWLFMRPPRRRRRRRKGSNHQYQHYRSISSPALLLPLLPAAAAVFQQTLVTPANFILPHFVHEAGVTMASLSLNQAAAVAKCRSVQQGSHFLGANKKMHQLAVKTLPPIIHVKQHMVRCQSMAGASMPHSSPDESFPTATDVTLAQKVRAFFFYVTTFVVAAPLFVLMLVLHPFVLLFDKHRRKAHHLVNKVWATLTTIFFYKTEIVGLENLPGPDEGAVYVANHQSFLDIYTLFQLGRPFKFISKTSNFLIPIIGWSMYLTGHVPLKRMDKRSQMECLKTCLELVKQGVSVLFFPEGTRSVDGKMAAFKKGAFTVAAKGGVPVVPISLIGTGNLMPNGLEWSLRPGCVKVVIHHPLQGSNADQLCEESRAVIADTLVKYGLSIH
ncbi:unnamed protein product [Sphagnum tenellum]